MDSYEVSFADAGGNIYRYTVDGISISEMVRAAIGYVNVQPGDGDGTVEDFGRRLDESFRFADFCVNETLDEAGELCDPTRSFRVLWGLFLASQVSAACS